MEYLRLSVNDHFLERPMSIASAFVMRLIKVMKLISGSFWLVLGRLIAIPNADRINGVPETECR